MNPPSFQIGDLVEIIGPAIDGNTGCKDELFEINMIRKKLEEIIYTGKNVPWYPASSLRLVEELMVGDYVMVIKPDSPYKGNIGKITKIDELIASGHEINPQRIADIVSEGQKKLEEASK